MRGVARHDHEPDTIEPPDAMDIAICALSDANLDQLGGLTDLGLRRLIELCRHWQQLAELELQQRS